MVGSVWVGIDRVGFGLGWELTRWAITSVGINRMGFDRLVIEHVGIDLILYYYIFKSNL